MDSAERAARAVREFRHMVPGLSSYAQTITGDPKVRVRPHAMTSTDGKWVNIRPPLVLADRADHDRRLCDRRDEIGALECPACARSEAVYACLYHEMSHIVSGSLDKWGHKALVKSVTRGLASVPEITSKYLEKRLATLPKSRESIYATADALHPYLVGVLRATDDYVIESNAIAARPGVEEMLYYMQEQIMLLGMEGDGSERTLWSDQPTEVQLPIALLIELHGWGLDGKFSDETIEIICSAKIQELIQREIPDVLTGLAAAVGFLGEFNRLGYLLAEDQKEQEDEPEPEDSESDSDDNSDSDQDSSPDSGDDNDEDSDSAGQSDDEGDSGTGAGDDSSESDEAGEAIPDDKSSELDGEPDSERGDGPDKSDDNGDDSESGSGSGDIPDESSNAGNTDDEENAGDGSGEQESDEVSDDGKENSAEPGDSAGGDDSGSDVDGSDSGSDSGDGSGDDGSGESAPTAGGGDDDGSADAGTGEGAASNGRATPEEIDRAMSQATGHEQNEKIMEEGYDESGAPSHDESGDGSVIGGDVTQEELEIAIVQAMFFDDMSRTVGTVEIYRGDAGPAMDVSAHGWTPAPESVIAGTVNRARRVFSDNAMDKHVGNLKSGKLSARALGARGWGDDRRVFKKKITADKDDYFVTIGMDVSGSTHGREIHRIKRAGMAMADLLNRVGVPFAVYAHTTGYFHEDVLDQHLYEIKSPEGLWDSKAKEHLSRLASYAGSLDGHNFEFYRKVVMASDATKKLCVYYTDGYIPETNHEDESEIMTRESRLYARLGIEALIVAVGTQLQDAYGFDQVQLDDDADISTVLNALEKKLTKGKGRA